MMHVYYLIGRIMNKRTSSSKLYFYDLYGGGAKVQVMADARYYSLDSIYIIFLLDIYKGLYSGYSRVYFRLPFFFSEPLV